MTPSEPLFARRRVRDGLGYASARFLKLDRGASMRVTRLALPILLVLASIALLTEPAHAAAGDLDPTFGDGGKLWTIQIGLDFLRAGAAVGPQQAGKMVRGGTPSTGRG